MGRDNRSVDEHGRRVTQPLRAAWRDFQQGHATLLDLSRTAEQAAESLDNANGEIRRLLAAAWADLEYAFHSTERENHPAEARRILEPILNRMGPE